LTLNLLSAKPFFIRCHVFYNWQFNGAQGAALQKFKIDVSACSVLLTGKANGDRRSSWRVFIVGAKYVLEIL
jgi:hypothetical protein